MSKMILINVLNCLLSHCLLSHCLLSHCLLNHCLLNRCPLDQLLNPRLKCTKDANEKGRNHC